MKVQVISLMRLQLLHVAAQEMIEKLSEKTKLSMCLLTCTSSVDTDSSKNNFL